MEILREIIKGLPDLIWPPRCAACAKSLAPSDSDPLRELFCPVCASSVIWVTSPFCPRCGVPFEGVGEDHLCLDCLVDPPLFRKVGTVFEYGGAVAEALTKLKYASASELARPFANLLAKLSLGLSSPDAVIPVPLHTKRLVKRGFNQSALLGRPVARIQGARFSPGLVRRILDTAPQASCTRKARFENIKGAFAVTNPEKVRGKRILIVDDVITTGATIREVSKVLMRSKAKSVEVIAVARAS